MRPLFTAFLAVLGTGALAACGTVPPAQSTLSTTSPSPVPTGSAELSSPPATPSASESAEPTAPPAVLGAGAFAAVVTDDLVYRSAPRIADDSEILGALNAPTSVYVVEGPVESNGFRWFLVRVEGAWTSGWVAAEGKDGEPWLQVVGHEPGTWVMESSVPEGTHLVNIRNAVAGRDGRVYLIGALASFVANDVGGWAYDPGGGSWHELPRMPTPRIEPMVTVAEDGRLYVIGGHTWHGDYGAPSNAVEVYDPSTNGWTVAPSLPEHIGFGAVAAPGSDGRIHVFRTDFNRGGAWTFDPQSDQWSTAPTVNGCFDAAEAAGDGLIYLLPRAGGECSGAEGMHRFTSEEGRFDQLLSPVRVGRWGATLSRMEDGRLLIVGGLLASESLSDAPIVEGIGGQSLALVEAFDPAIDAWMTLPPLPSAGDPPGGSVVIGGSAYAFIQEGATVSLLRLELPD